MTSMIRMLDQGWMMWLCGICGDVLTITGILFAMLNLTVAGFTPIVWILLAMVFYLYFLMSLLARIVANTGRGQ